MQKKPTLITISSPCQGDEHALALHLAKEDTFIRSLAEQVKSNASLMTGIGFSGKEAGSRNQKFFQKFKEAFMELCEGYFVDQMWLEMNCAVRDGVDMIIPDVQLRYEMERLEEFTKDCGMNLLRIRLINRSVVCGSHREQREWLELPYDEVYDSTHSSLEDMKLWAESLRWAGS